MAYQQDSQGRNYFMRGRTKFVERTKKFFVKEGKETDDDIREAIRIRENMGDRLDIGNGLTKNV